MCSIAEQRPSFGAADGFNLIMIQVESLQGFVVGLEVEGRDGATSVDTAPIAVGIKLED